MLNDNENPDILAIGIIKRLKSLVETELFIENFELKNIEYKKIYDDISKYSSIKTKKFSLDLWETHKDFYDNLFKYSNYHFKKILNSDKPKINNLPKSSFAINGLLNILNFLLIILENKKEAYMNEKIKFVISILSGKNKKFINNGIFYEGSLLELKNEYKDIQYKEHNLIEKINLFYKDIALKKFEEIKNDLFDYIKQVFDTSMFNLTENLNEEINKYTKIFNNIYDEEENNKLIKKIDALEKKLKNIKNISNKFKQMKGNCKNAQELIDDCIKNEDYYNCFKEFSSYYYNILNKKIDEKYLLDNILLPSGIYNIDLTNQEELNLIYDIEYNNKYEFNDDRIENKNTFYEKYLEKKEEIKEYKESKNYEKDIMNIINNDIFIKEFYDILNSKSVTYYLNNKRKYDIYNNNVTIIIDKNKEGDENLKEQFQQFLSDTKENFKNFRKLIVIKQLGFKIEGAVDSSMRIFINPILNFSKECNDDERESILKSYLKIILLHELIHLLKFYPINNKYPENTPITPRGKENRQLFIYYLFGMPIIYKINFSQSKEINNKLNWDNIENLKKIFEKNNYFSNNQNKEGEVNLIITHKENGDDNKKIRRTDDFCLWEIIY